MASNSSPRARSWGPVLLLGAFASLLPLGCNASLAELGECGELAEALCNNGRECGLGWKHDRCVRQMSAQCELWEEAQEQQTSDDRTPGPGDGTTPDPDPDVSTTADCFESLEEVCLPEVTAECSDLTLRVGCSVCGDERPGKEAVDVCCALNPFSAVCGGCL